MPLLWGLQASWMLSCTTPEESHHNNQLACEPQCCGSQASCCGVPLDSGAESASILICSCIPEQGHPLSGIRRTHVEQAEAACSSHMLGVSAWSHQHT
jgi:hypothetical protein